jgi:hypothetical protein
MWKNHLQLVAHLRKGDAANKQACEFYDRLSKANTPKRGCCSLVPALPPRRAVNGLSAAMPPNTTSVGRCRCS